MTKEEYIAKNLDVFIKKHNEYTITIIENMIKEESNQDKDWEKIFNLK